MTLNDKVRYLRETCSYSQENVAQYLGISLEDEKKLENGGYRLSSDTVNKLANLFGVTALSFINDDVPTPSISFRDTENLSADELDTVAQINRIALNQDAVSSQSNRKEIKMAENKTFVVPVEWTVSSSVVVEGANSLEEAIQIVKDNMHNIPLAQKPDYVEDSYCVVDDDEDLIADMQEYYCRGVLMSKNENGKFDYIVLN